ncbi:MAG: hypothetical protein PHS14_06425 [Elusimicrobia bacterium]|nr:hypothetical protein [Elusimicrobiota bacterium]
MINLILTLSLSALNPTSATQTAQFRPCVWPNVCKTVSAPEAVAQFRPCVWPNVCKTEAAAPVLVIEPAAEVAQFTTCVYPRKCGKKA